jgi:very-short-patch-repair endonuclease
MLCSMDWAGCARRQGGVVARRQLTALGYSDFGIDALIRRGLISSTPYRGVYRASGAPASRDGACWSVVLATCSPMSYLTAAEFWDLPVPDDGKIHITRFDRRRLVWPPGVRVHRVLLDPSAVEDRQGLLVTTRTETILDCLGSLELGRARTLADRAQQQRWLAPSDIERRLENQPGRWGNRRLRLLLPSLGDGAHSEAERRLHKLLRAAEIDGWTANHSLWLDGKRYVVDAAFPELKVAIEIDGYRTHSSQGTFQTDRTKGNALTNAGWTLLRFTWSDLVDRPEYVLATIRSVLARCQ